MTSDGQQANEEQVPEGEAAGIMLPASKEIPSEYSVMRYAGRNRIIIEDDKVVGFFPQAFALRPDEEYLSVTWIEYFKGAPDEQRVRAIKAFRRSFPGVGKQSAYAIGNVGKVRDECVARSHRVRILHEPEDENKGHCAIRRFPRDDSDLLQVLSADVFTEIIPNISIP
jgi:hypothetical protein